MDNEYIPFLSEIVEVRQHKPIEYTLLSSTISAPTGMSSPDLP
jgi:hypothetical protein